MTRPTWSAAKPEPALCDCGHAPVSHAPFPPDWTEQTGACMCGCHGWQLSDVHITDIEPKPAGDDPVPRDYGWMDDWAPARASRLNCAAAVAGCAMLSAVVVVLAWAAVGGLALGGPGRALAS